MSPNETLFLESTNAIHKENVSNSSFVQFAVWDFPGIEKQVKLRFYKCLPQLKYFRGILNISK